MTKLKAFLQTNRKSVIAFSLVLVILFSSLTFLGKIFTNPQTYRATIEAIDEKKSSVLSVSAGIASAATALALIPEDSTTPLANELMDLNSYLVLVICVLVLEKSLLTLFGSISFYVLIPAACCLLLIFIIKQKKFLISWTIRLLALALALVLIVPISMRMSNYICDVNHITLEQDIEEIVDDIENETNSPWYKKLWDSVSDTVEGALKTVKEKFQQKINQFVDAVSIFVIAYCAIPIFIVFMFLWILKALFGLSIHINVESLRVRFLGGKPFAKTEKES